MNNQVYMFIDTETGGFNPFKHSLLSIGIVIGVLKLHENNYILEKLYEKEFFIKEDKIDEYFTTADALSINNISIKYIMEEGIQKKQFIEEIKKLKKSFFLNNRINVVGHNIDFDLAFIRGLYNSEKQPFEKDFHHRSINTASILKYLFLIGVLKKEIGSLDNATDYFQIHVKNRHSALSDSLATSSLFVELLNIGKNKLL